MNDFWNFVRENRETVLVIGSAFFTGLGTALGFLIRSNVLLVHRLKQAQRSSYTIICPHCKKESALEEVTFMHPKGFVDNNLNGIDDEKE